MSTALVRGSAFGALLVLATACSGSSDEERLQALPEADLLYPGAEWTTPLQVHRGVPVASASVGRRFVTLDPWTNVLEFYASQLTGWSGPFEATRLSPELEARRWERDGYVFSLRQANPVPSDLATRFGDRAAAYALGIEADKGD